LGISSRNAAGCQVILALISIEFAGSYEKPGNPAGFSAGIFSAWPG